MALESHFFLKLFTNYVSTIIVAYQLCGERLPVEYYILSIMFYGTCIRSQFGSLTV